MEQVAVVALSQVEVGGLAAAAAERSAVCDDWMQHLPKTSWHSVISESIAVISNNDAVTGEVETAHSVSFMWLQAWSTSVL